MEMHPINTVLECEMNQISVLPSSCWIYGAGSAFHWVFEILVCQYGLAITGVIDNQKCGEIVDGYECVSYELFSEKVLNKNCPVIVTVSSQERFEAISNQLRGDGFFNVLKLHDIYEVHVPFRFEKRVSFNACHSKIRSAFESLSDEKSKKIFLSILKIHVTKKAGIIPASSESDQVFDPSVWSPRELDAVCFVGAGLHELEIAMRNYNANPIKRLFLFDPEEFLHNGKLGDYQGVIPYVKENQDRIPFEVTSLAIAVDNREGIKRFSSVNDGCGSEVRSHYTSFGSRLASDGARLVFTTTLDSFFKSKSLNLIAIDAEGNELNVIDGAHEVIISNRPIICCAIYHSVSHLWTIILEIKKINPSYNFYIRNYTGYCMETFLYAV